MPIIVLKLGKGSGVIGDPTQRVGGLLLPQLGVVTLGARAGSPSASLLSVLQVCGLVQCHLGPRSALCVRACMCVCVCVCLRACMDSFTHLGAPPHNPLHRWTVWSLPFGSWFPWVLRGLGVSPCGQHGGVSFLRAHERLPPPALSRGTLVTPGTPLTPSS